MLGFLTTVLPTIGKVLGELLNPKKNGETKDLECVSYDLDSNNKESGVKNCQAVFSKKGDNIILSNGGYDETKALLMHFPSSPPELDNDVLLHEREETIVNDAFKRHANYNDGRFELSVVDLEQGKQGLQGRNMRFSTRRGNVPTDGTTVPFGSYFTVSLNGTAITFTLLPSLSSTIDSVTSVSVSSDNSSTSQSFNLINIENPNNSPTITLTLPGSFPPEITAVIVDARINIRPGNSLMKKLSKRCTPISEETKYVIAHGHHLEGL